MLCATCPWDRNCVTPPTITSGEVDQMIKDAAAQDRASLAAAKANGEQGAMPVATLMTAAIYAGKDTAMQACPVLAIRLRSSDGRKVAETVRSAMQSWEES
jgi:hypothetical protein